MLQEITTKEFNTLVYDTAIINENTKDLNFLGDKPCIIDFAATWCNPCKALYPVLVEIAESNPSINIYKVDADNDRNLAVLFGIRSVPTLLFVTKNSRKIATGVMSKQQITEIIKEMLREDAIDDATIVE